MVWGPHNMPLFSRAPVLLPAAWTVGRFETNWDQLTIGGPQLQLARTTFLTLILISRGFVFIIGVSYGTQLGTTSKTKKNYFKWALPVKLRPPPPLA